MGTGTVVIRAQVKGARYQVYCAPPPSELTLNLAVNPCTTPAAVVRFATMTTTDTAPATTQHQAPAHGGHSAFEDVNRFV
ncbi:MAG: hypothetical protein EBT73_02765, partial [Actinobacteria bacterium]|nr:hypothetical protein [Actinomycetota bacterium]